MLRRFAPSAVPSAALALLLAACGGSSTTEDAGVDMPPPPLDFGMRTDLGTDAGTGGDSAVPAGDCDPRDPAACGDGMRCAFLFAVTHPALARFRCRVEGTITEGMPCMLGPFTDADAVYEYDSCAHGLVCAASGDVDTTCQRRCSTATECATGELCFVANGAVEPGVGPVGICRRPQGCDVFTGAGGCHGDLRCKLSSTVDGAFAPSCIKKGTVGADEGCALNSCDDGLTCVRPIGPDGHIDFSSEDFRCRPVCDPHATPSTCPAGSACTAVSAFSGASRGFCMPPMEPATIGGARPARVVVPPSYDGTTPLPLVVALHGQGEDASSFDGNFRLSRAARTDHFFLVLPTGTRDMHDVTFWNATPWCCDLDGAGVDDSTYVQSLIDEMKARYHVLATKVYVVGFANGGVMAYRVGCDHAANVAAIASFDGSTFDLETDCHASRPLSVLEVHGDMDYVVNYLGMTGTATTAYPGARDTVERWATRAGCDATMGMDDPTMIDMDADVTGADTTVRRYTTGCMAGLDAQLWTMHGSMSYFTPADDFMMQVDAWLLPHAQ